MSNTDTPAPQGAGNEVTVLIVDDAKENLTVLGQLLRPHYHVRVANSGARALQVVKTVPRPQIILLDVMMPEMDGYQVLQALRSDPVTRDIPVIFVTAMDADEDEEHGLTLGAVDYVTKPIKPALLLARVKTQLELKSARDILANQNALLDAEVQRRTWENELIKDFSLNAMATLAEKRDNETGNHLYRTQAYIEILMEHLGGHPRFAEQLADRHTRQRIAKAAPLHDIGKVGIPDAILLKPGRLTPEEFEVMKQHAAIGAQAIGDAIAGVQKARAEHGEAPDQQGTTHALDFLEAARQIAGSHHEKWDGTGYPQGLSGEAIPLSARLMAIADVFDALLSKRHYKPAMALDETLEIIRRGRGTHFDPDIVDALLACIPQMMAVAQRFNDTVSH
ncbi:MAG: two-component system response regulator [Rhodoferax sp.]|nr:MAG: two-component system response regulator [Rhodoferax sp.]